VYTSDNPEILMEVLAEKILRLAQELPEGSSLSAKALLHLGTRAAVDQALSRLVRRGRLMRAGRGVYVRPVEGKYGTRPPTAAMLVRTMGQQRGETVTIHGAAAANAFGLTTQVPVREIYLTSGQSRRLKLGAQVVELRHAPSWQLLMPDRPAGDALRALAWLGPKHAAEALRTLGRKLSKVEQREITAARSRLPTWMAQEVSALARNA
jgi:hypothetical protein